MPHLENLIKNATKLVPQIEPILKKFSKQNSLILNYPLTLAPKQLNVYTKPPHLIASDLIRKNNFIYLVDTNKIFSSANFTGASKLEERQLNIKVQQLKKKYQIFNTQVLSRVKLTASILANYIDKDMDLHQMAQLVKTQRKQIKIQNVMRHTSSNFLRSLVGASKMATQTAFSYLQDDFMKQVKLEEFNTFYQSTTFASRQTHQIKVIFPFSSNILHSFQPNCELSTLYLTHRRQLFITIKSIKQIKENEPLTLNYGNYNNYELLVKFGFTVQNNPHSQFYLPIDYSQIGQLFNQCIQEKMSIMKYDNNLKLKNIIKIDRKGKIYFQDLKMLRIVFLTQNFDKSPEGLDSLFNQKQHLLDRQIYEFIKKTGNAAYSIQQQMKQIEQERLNQIKEKQRQTSKDNKRGEKKSSLELNYIKFIEADETSILKSLVNS